MSEALICALSSNQMIRQQWEKFFDFLHAVLGADEEGIGGVDYDEVPGAQKRNRPPAVCEGEGILTVESRDMTPEGISFFVGG
jgi:hypothetical protein